MSNGNTFEERVASDRRRFAKRLAAEILSESRRDVDQLLAKDRDAFDELSVQRRRRTAYHEAGHAVAALKLDDVELARVHIRSSYLERSVGRTSFSDKPATIQSNLIVTLAGSEAELLAGFAPDPDEHLLGDVVAAQKLADEFFPQTNADFVEGFFRARARELLEREWPLVKLLARELLAWTDVSGEQASRLAQMLDDARELEAVGVDVEALIRLVPHGD